MVESQERELDESMTLLYQSLIRLDNEPDNEALKEWVKNICDPDVGMVEGLVANFVDFLEDKDYVKKILKILVKLNQHIADVVLGQLCANIYFPRALIKYMETTDLASLTSDSFILVVNIFDDNSVKDATEEFIQKLIDALPFIVDDSTRNALLSIFAVVCPTFEKRNPSDNLILREFNQDDKRQFYKEQLLFLTNRGSVYRLDKCMQTISVIMTNPQTKDDFFNLNDLDYIVGVAMRELNVRNTRRTRIQILKVLNIVLGISEYWDAFKHRLAEINECLETQVLQEDSEQAYEQRELKQLSIMNTKLLAINRAPLK